MVIVLFFVIILVIYILIKPQKGTAFLVILSPFLKVLKIGSIGVFLLLSFVAIIVFIRNQKFSKSIILKNPFAGALWMMITSSVITNYFSSERHNIPLLECLLECVMIFLVFVYYEKNTICGKYLLSNLKILKLFCLIVVVDTFMEIVSGYNIAFECLTHLGVYDSEIYVPIEELRFGIKRAQSIFTMHTSLAGFAILTYSMLLYVHYHLSKKLNLSLLGWLLLICVFLTGARSGIIGAVISLMMLVNKKSLKQMNKGALILCLFILVTICATYITNIYESIIDTESVDGSNSDMRTTQFEIAVLYFFKSPLIGNGLAYTWNVALIDYPDLLGAESIWFPYMIDQGIMGCVAWLLFSVCASIYLWQNGLKSYCWLILGWLAFNTLSSVPGMTNLFFCNIIMMLVYTKKYINRQSDTNMN